MTAIDSLITNLQAFKGSSNTEHARINIATFIAALQEIEAGLAPSGPETANTIYAGPVSGSPDFPAFRALVAADLGSFSMSPSLGNVTLLAAGALTFNGRSKITSRSNGIVGLSNNAGTDFTQLEFGGSTAAFPALVRSGTALQAQLADGSAFAPFASAALTATTGTFSGPVQPATNNAIDLGVVGATWRNAYISTFVGIGTTTSGAGVGAPGVLTAVAPVSSGAAVLKNLTNNYETLSLWNTNANAAGGATFYVQFYYGPGGAVTGTITTNGTVTSYNVSSTEQIKDNIVPLDSALAINMVRAYAGYTYKAKRTGATEHGFIVERFAAAARKLGVDAQKLGLVHIPTVSKTRKRDLPGMDYSKATPFLSRAVIDQADELAALRKEVAELRALVGTKGKGKRP